MGPGEFLRFMSCVVSVLSVAGGRRRGGCSSVSGDMQLLVLLLRRSIPNSSSGLISRRHLSFGWQTICSHVHGTRAASFYPF